MGLKEKISEDLKTSMKARDQKLTSVLRMVLSEIKYAQAQTNLHAEIDDATVLKVINSYHKKLAKSVEEFPEGEQREAVLSEMKMVEQYLPQKASPADVAKAVDSVLASTQERQFGPLMKLVMGQLGAGADGKVVQEALKAKLST